MNNRPAYKTCGIYGSVPKKYSYPVFPPSTKLARGYFPFQQLNCVYPPMQGLNRGTIFPELDRPYGVDPEYTVDA